MKIPSAPRIPHEMVVHGHSRTDQYYWLNDRENKNVIDYLKEENLYTESVLKDTTELQDQLFSEMKGRIKEQDQSVPYYFNGYTYYVRFIEGGEYPIYCRKKGKSDDQDEEILIDGNEMAKDHSYFSCTPMSVSPDNKLGMFAIDTTGRRIYTILFKNLETGQMLNDSIAGVTGNAEWAADSLHIFYSVKDEVTLRDHQIYRHNTGAAGEPDVLVFEESDETFGCHIGKTKSRAFLVIQSESTMTSECRILEAANPTGEFRIFKARERGHEYSIDHHNHQFFILTNHNATNFRVMTADEDQTQTHQWKELIPHRSEVLVEGIDLFNDFKVIFERENGLPAIRIIHNNGSDFRIDTGEAAFDIYSGMNPESATDVFRYGYNSMTTPPSTFDFDVLTRTKKLLKQQEIVGGYDAKSYHSERIMVPAADGTLIPVSIVYNKNLYQKNGQCPLLQYGYGSYGISMDATFSSSRLSLLDRGFAFAIAHIRGGQEMGRTWYESGKMLQKKNTFTDFIDCSDYLISNKYVHPEKLFAMGGSAGGLLMGAVINMRPELYRGVIAAVPFVDVVTTMMDPSIPLTTGEYDEWGNPEIQEYYDYILSYSPYDNIREVEYPNLLVMTGLHDSQVQYWEPAKWVAKLREHRKGDNMLLLHTNMDAGHGGASGRFRALKELAMEYAFLLKLA